MKARDHVQVLTIEKYKTEPEPEEKFKKIHDVLGLHQITEHDEDILIALVPIFSDESAEILPNTTKVSPREETKGVQAQQVEQTELPALPKKTIKIEAAQQRNGSLTLPPIAPKLQPK